MPLYETIQSDLKIALKARDALKVSTLRMVIAAVKNMEIDKAIKKADDQDVRQIITRQIKQHKDSIEQFRKGCREDLAEKELKELRILESYMPRQLEQGELIKLIEEEISSSGAASKKDAGRLMKAIMQKVNGKADGKTVSELLMERLK